MVLKMFITLFIYKSLKIIIKILLKYVIHILITGLSYRNITDFSNSKIHWNTIYKFVIKLQQYNVITSTYYNTVNKYISKKIKLQKTNQIYY